MVHGPVRRTPITGECQGLARSRQIQQILDYAVAGVFGQLPMTPAAPSFAVLFSRARQHDPEAVSELCRQYEPRVRLVARVLLGPALRPALDSMDLVQSVHRSLLIGIREEKFDVSTPENLIALALTLLRRKWPGTGDECSGNSGCKRTDPVSICCPRSWPI